ncbi:6-phosphogluconolactonase [Leptospira perdikensis]|uniref:6-phosphogluconolactonase n=1 Tax=Leptospira perdikensis TaxID=2484948 RepID=A0A4R9JJR2_9LEPT|nr:6-phosphogluconolactonase [Leptospira perdikensis]
MTTHLSKRTKLSKLKKIRKGFYLLICLFSFNACLLNPIVQSILCPNDDPSSPKSLFALWALLSSSNSVVELNHTWAGIHKGDSLQLEAQYYSYGAKTDTTFQWSSSNPSVATVDGNGFVQSIGNGKVIITATSGDGRAKATSDITVYTGYVYTSLNISHYVGHLTMNGNTGNLTANATTYVGNLSDPNGIVTDPAGKYLYTGNFGTGTISQFLINQATGGLTLNTPATVAGGTNPRNLAITPDGKYLYLASQGTQEIRAYAVGADGTLTFLTSYPTNTGYANVLISRNGNFIFYMNSTLTELISYRINYADGSLSQANISPTFPNGTSGHVSTHPSGNFVYVGSEPALTIFSFDSETGNMGFVDSVFHGMGINSTAIHPSGRFYYLIHMNEGIIACYTVDPISGKISYSSSVTGYSTNSMRFMVIDPTGRYAYVAANTGSNMFQFSINQTTGELTSIGPVNPGGAQWNLTFL